MTAVLRTRRGPKLLDAGDVLSTHPDSEHWGCAVVLTARGATDEFDPMCHIGITPAVFRRTFSFSERDLDRLSILEFDREIHLTDGTHCGPVQAHLGGEAVAAWRAVHDREQWLHERDAARSRTEETCARIREDERRKRLTRKTRSS